MLEQEFQIVIPSLHKTAAAAADNNNDKVYIGRWHDLYIYRTETCIYQYISDNGDIVYINNIGQWQIYIYVEE